MATKTPVRTVLLAIVAVFATTFTGLGPSTSPADAATLSQVRAYSQSSYESELQYWINQERARRGLRKLTFQSCTDSLSIRWSNHLASSGAFYHQSLTPFFRQCHARYAAETLARGVWTPRETVTAWLNSSGHRRIMLSAKPRRIGIGAVLDSQGRWVVTANYTRF